MSSQRSVAVVYGTIGGMGDVGKYAVAHALKMPDVTLRAIAMASKAYSLNLFRTSSGKCSKACRHAKWSWKMMMHR
jgi:hypothetical protein